MFDVLTRKWWVVALRGILAILFGVIALVYPGITLAALVLLFGAYALVDGVSAVFAAIGGTGRERLWYVLEGIAGIAAGILTFVYPGITAQVLIYFIAFWAIFTGVFEVIAGFELPISRDWLLVLAGAASVVFGVLVLFNPGSGALAILWLIGIYALVFGVTMLVFGIRLRNFGKTPASQKT